MPIRQSEQESELLLFEKWTVNVR